MLAQTTAAVEQRGITAHSHNHTLQDFIALPEQQARHWEVAQATFSFQSVPPDLRPSALQWLRQHVDQLAIVEFDAPTYAGATDPAAFLSARRVTYVVERYQRGLAEYATDSADDRAVVQGFLMPVFFGYFDRTANRTNWEIPVSAWAQLMRDAGFAQVETQPVFDYWWAPAFMVHAKA